MAECSGCTKKMGFADRQNAKSYDELCRSCTEHGRKVSAGVENKTVKQAADDTQQYNPQIDAILLTTETAPNLNITERIEIVTAECAFGMNIFKGGGSRASQIMPMATNNIDENKECQITKTLSARASGRLSWTSTDGAVHHFNAESYALTQRQARAGTMCT